MISRQATWPIFSRHETDQSLAPSRSPRTQTTFGPNSIRSNSLIHTPETVYHTSPSATSTQDYSSEAIATWRSYIRKLSKGERDRFLKYSATDVKQYAAAIESTVQDQGRRSRAIRIARLINPIFQTMNMYAPIAKTMVQADPTSSSLVLGGITCIMSISSRFSEYHEKMANTLSEMLEKLDILQEYGASVYRNNAPVQVALMGIYGDILQFCIKASRLLLDDSGEPRSSLKTGLTSLVQSFDSKFKDILYKFDRDLKNFEEKAKLVDRRRLEADRALHFQFMQHQIFNSEQNYRTLISVEHQVMADAHGRKIVELDRQERETRRIRGEKRRQVIAWLPSIPFHKDQKDKYAKRLEGTGQWLIDNEVFQAWKTNPGSELLWVHGKSGCGKSYLAAHAIHDLAETINKTNEQRRGRGKGIAMAYIYCNSLEEEKLEPSKLVGSILKQLCLCLPNAEIDPSLETLFDRRNENETPTRQEMQKIVGSLTTRFSQTFLVVDGLDECHKLKDGQFEDLCEFVQSQVAQPKSMKAVTKVLVFSRPEYRAIKDAFGECLTIQVDAGANDADIKQFITKKISAKDLHVRRDQNLLKEVEGRLLSGADGMFLWVHLLVKNLKGQTTANQVRAKLNDLPRELDEAYELSLRGVLAQEDASIRTRSLKILLWTTNSKRPLSQKELLEAISVQPGTTGLDDGDRILGDDDADFAADCGDLVVLINGYYHLLHSSLKEYLTKLPNSDVKGLEEYAVMQQHATDILSEVCLTYLKFETFSNGPMDSEEGLAKLEKENPLLKYAATYWGHHVAESVGSDVLDSTKSFLSLKAQPELSMQIWTQEEVMTICPYPGKPTSMHLLSIFNLVKVAQHIPDAKSMKFEPDGFSLAPLDYALMRKSKEMSHWLLEDATEPISTETDVRLGPLHMAASNDWGDIVERLLDLGYDPESTRGERQQTPLHCAAIDGSECAMAVLLKAHVNVNPRDVNGQTPLIDATEGNHPRLIISLLEAGAEVNVHGWNGATALHHAAVNGDADIAAKLLEKGAEIDSLCSKEWDFRTPVHLAVEENSYKVLDLLIKNGANIETDGPEGYNALLLACSHGFSSCLELLLDAKARLDPRNERKETGYHIAVLRGHLAILKILFEHCKDPNLVNSVDVEGDTPLHDAAWGHKRSAATLLLENGALVDKVNCSGHSALHVAIIEGHTELGELLVGKHQADVGLKGLLGSTPLHYAANYGHCNFISLLIRAGADPNAVNDRSDTVLHFAARANQLAFIKQFVHAVPTLDLAFKNDSGQTPLHCAASGGFAEIVEFFLEYQSSSRQLKDNSSNHPLHLAAWNGHLEVVKLLLDEENLNSQGFMGQTALFRASSCGHNHIAKFLLDRGADPNKLDDDQQSPLIQALVSKHVDVATLLLDASADGRLSTRNGDTALHIAAWIGNRMIVTRLLNDGCDGLYRSQLGETPFMSGVLSRETEIVDALLERGFNGIAIPDYAGRTCIQVAAQTGSTQMLEKLIKEDPSTLMATDCIGRDILDYAATSGQVDMIELLIKLGIGANGLKRGSRRPIKTAAAEGFHDFVRKLIELGADLDEQTGYEEWSPLHAATALQMPLIAESLVKAGANSTLRDAFGLSPLDYAFRDPHIWEKMGSSKADYFPVKPETQMHTLRKAVEDCIQRRLSQPQKSDPKIYCEGLENLDLLVSALALMKNEASREHAKIFSIELATVPQVCHYRMTYTCNMCLQTPLRGPRYVCLECNSVHLCGLCYPDYLEGCETAMTAPQSLKILQKLENDIRPIREVVEKLSLILGGEFLYKTCETLVVVAEWVDVKLKEYEDWEKTYNKTNRFDISKRPGQRFLKLIERARKIARDTADIGNCEDESFPSLIKDLAELHRDYRPDQQARRFICSEHEYMEIRDKLTMDDANKIYFDHEGNFTAEWLTGLLETYRDERIQNRADEHTGGPNPAETKQDNGQSSSHDPTLDSRAHEIYALGTMRFLEDVSTEEPMEMDSNDPGPREGSSGSNHNQKLHTITPEFDHLHDRPASSENEENKSDEKPPLINDNRSVKNEHTPCTRSSDAQGMEKIPSNAIPANKERLRSIKSALEMKTLEILDCFEALKKEQKGRIEGGRDSNSQFGEPQNPTGMQMWRTIPEQQEMETNSREASQEKEPQSKVERNGPEQYQENAQHNTSGEEARTDASTSDDGIDDISLSFSIVILEIETSWSLAQMILAGSQQGSLCEPVLERYIRDRNSENEEVQKPKDQENNFGLKNETQKSAHQEQFEEGTEGFKKIPKESTDIMEDRPGSHDEKGNLAADQRHVDERNPDEVTTDEPQDHVSGELQRAVDNITSSNTGYGAVRQASIDDLPLSPLSRRNTDLFLS